jgi:hypothetical protein
MGKRAKINLAGQRFNWLTVSSEHNEVPVNPDKDQPRSRSDAIIWNIRKYQFLCKTPLTR